MEIKSGAGQPGVSAEQVAREIAEQQAKAAAAETAKQAAAAAPTQARDTLEPPPDLGTFGRPGGAADPTPGAPPQGGETIPAWQAALGLSSVAAAEREFPCGPTTPCKLPQDATALVRNSPQIDKLDGPHGTEHDKVRCGAAAVANAMIFDCTDKNACAQNAKAINDLARDTGAKLTPEQQRAVDKLGRGELTPNDAAHAQEALFSIGSYCGGGNVAVGGLSNEQMTGLIAGLRERGGLAHSSATFQLARTPQAHWTVTSFPYARGTPVSADSMPDPRTGRATVDSSRHEERGMIDPATGKPNENWGGEIYVNGAANEVIVKTPPQSESGKLMLNSEKYYAWTIKPGEPKVQFPLNLYPTPPGVETGTYPRSPG